MLLVHQASDFTGNNDQQLINTSRFAPVLERFGIVGLNSVAQNVPYDELAEGIFLVKLR